MSKTLSEILKLLVRLLRFGLSKLLDLGWIWFRVWIMGKLKKVIWLGGGVIGVFVVGLVVTIVYWVLSK